MSAWDPTQYEKFKRERSQPFYDLLALVEKRPAMRVVDLGCGTGELTRALHDSLVAESTLGLDSSESMLARSTAYTTSGLRFEQRDIHSFQEESQYDLVFSNAALHWIPDHKSLFARLAGALRPGGQLAVQMPANQEHPSQSIARALAMESPYREAIADNNSRATLYTLAEYARLLFDLGFVRQTVRLQIYAHVLPSKDEVFEWVKGSTLTEFEQHLPADLFAQFREQYRARLDAALDDARPLLFPFQRLLLWGSR